MSLPSEISAVQGLVDRLVDVRHSNHLHFSLLREEVKWLRDELCARKHSPTCSRTSAFNWETVVCPAFERPLFLLNFPQFVPTLLVLLDNSPTVAMQEDFSARCPVQQCRAQAPVQGALERMSNTDPTQLEEWRHHGA